MSVADTRDEVLAQRVEIELANGSWLIGALEYFPTGKTLAVTDDVENDPFMLTATAAEAPDVTARLAADQVLLTNYVGTRGAPEWLATEGFVEIIEQVKIGIFGLDAFVARVL